MNSPLSQTNPIKARIKYIDIAKGILICCLVYGHMVIFSRMEGINDNVISFVQKSIPIYNAFFMQTFFIITGFCSSFNKNFRDFLWGNVKSLIIPAVLLVFVSKLFQIYILDVKTPIGASVNIVSWLANGGPWFIISLFWAKTIYWFFSRLVLKNQLISLGILYLSGLILNITDVVPNYSYHRHVLLMLPYLFIGYYWKNNQSIVKGRICFFALFGVVSIILQFVISQCTDCYIIPSHDAFIHINKTFIIHIINVITGSAFVIWISSKICKNNILETLGKGSLLIYLWNGMINMLVLKCLPPPNAESVVSCVVFHLSVYIMMIVIFYSLIKLVYNVRYLSWLVGRW